MTDREFTERGFTRPQGLDCLCSGSRAITLWGGSVIGDLAKGLNSSDFLDLVYGFCKRGDRVFVAGYESQKAWNDEQRSQIAEVFVTRTIDGYEDRQRRWIPDMVEFEVVMFRDLRALAPAVQVEAIDVG